MTNITANKYSYEAARAIIERFYEADKSSAYVGTRHWRLNGNLVNVCITPGATGWTVEVKSSYFTECTCNELINEALTTLPRTD